MPSSYPDMLIAVGSGRSGTTYLARVLYASMGIGFASEPKFVVPTYQNLAQFGDLSAEANMRRLVQHIHATDAFTQLKSVRGIETTADEIMARIQQPTYTDALYAAFSLIADKRGSTRVGYKDPADVVHLPLLAELFPTARFIHIVRDGRDVALSMLKFTWGPTTIFTGAEYWQKSVSKGRLDGATLGDRYYQVRLEDFTFDTERVAHELGNFINRGEKPEQVQGMIDYVNKSKDPKRLYIYKNQMGARDRQLCEAVAGDELRAWNYETEYDGKAKVSAFQVSYYHALDVVGRVRNVAQRNIKRITGKGTPRARKG